MKPNLETDITLWEEGYNAGKEERKKPILKKLFGIGKMNEPNKYKCPICKKKFRLKYSLNKHLIEHKPNKFKSRKKWIEMNLGV